MNRDKIKFRIAVSLTLFFGMFGIAQSSWAADVFVAQTASGSDSGANCANAHSVAWLNTSGNWTNPKQEGKVGPGDTVHLCGILTSLMKTRAAGEVDNLITIQFEPGAAFSAPTWVHASEEGIITIGHNNIVIK